MASTSPTLLVMAAGMGSRYGGIKQIEGFGPSKETILEYSIYDALRAGFGRVVLIVREDIREAVREIVAPGLDGRVDWDFVIQNGEKHVLPQFRNADRVKPWGTGHAVLCASQAIEGPFAVINADDFYGREAFESMAGFLSADPDPHRHALVGYELGDVLSDFGTVSRGVCQLDDEGDLVRVDERTKIERVNGQIVYRDAEGDHPLSARDVVSMNFWGFKPSYFETAKRLFEKFLEENHASPSAEFYIPTVAQNMIDNGSGRIAVLRGGTTWFGVTYPEDKPFVQAQLDKLIESGEYPSNLWG